MKNVLWLASWYPNERDAFTGDFIQRQAQAVSIFQPVNVVYIGEGLQTSSVQRPIQVKNISEHLKEYYLYYRRRDHFLSRLNSLFLYWKRGMMMIRFLRKNNEFPDIVHVHVAMKAGLIAVYLKWRYKIPFVLTEHWSGYYPQSADSLFKKSFTERFLTRLILKNADRLLPVSEALGNQIASHWARVPFLKIPNVVDTRWFYPGEKEDRGIFRFIHISSLLYPKNTEGIIVTYRKLLQSNPEAELVLVGPPNSSIHKLLESDRISGERITLVGEVPYEQVGRELRKADTLVIFSFYENMPCVMLEALCSGLPVIATRVGGISEVIKPDNGILIEPGNETQLLHAMKEIIARYKLFDKNRIGTKAKESFSYDSIGKQIVSVYQQL